MSAFTSRAGVLWDRNWLSFARRQGCCETWTLGGKFDMVTTRSSAWRGELERGARFPFLPLNE
jgi:hypothetical protein